MNTMSIVDLCNLFDRSEIVDTQLELDREYYSSSDSIFTDGDYKTSIDDANGYIHITSVQNATYLIFIDVENKIYLCVYKYLPTNKYKFIKQKLQLLKNTINQYNNSNTTPVEPSTNTQYNTGDIIDINTFKCTECNSTAKLCFRRVEGNPDALTTKCSICKTEYVFMPSKYYKLSSKRIIYHKTEDTSRNININK